MKFITGTGGQAMFYYQKILRTDERINEVYMLRYKVYCDEWGFENPEDHPGGVEIDEFDECSSHFAVIRKDNDEMIGTTRIIFCSDKGFPLEGHAELDKGTFGGLDRDHDLQSAKTTAGVMLTKSCSNSRSTTRITRNRQLSRGANWIRRLS